MEDLTVETANQVVALMVQAVKVRAVITEMVQQIVNVMALAVVTAVAVAAAGAKSSFLDTRIILT